MVESFFETAGPKADFGRRPAVWRHRLETHALFSDDALVELIERTPRHRSSVNTMPRDATQPGLWREGEMSGLTGRDVLAAVAAGNIWVHLKRVHDTSDAHQTLLDGLFAELEEKTGLGKIYKRSMSVLISSPGMNVAYHADVPGQCLWQIRGQKQVWVYPSRAPFLEPATLERIVLQRAADTALRYDPAFDADAEIFMLKPGDMASWPRNCPHRVRNADCLNVSFTTEHWTDELRAGYVVDYANGLLRPMFGGRDLSRRTAGVAYQAKFALAAAHKVARRLHQQAMPQVVDFRVDPKASTGFVDVKPFHI